MLVVFFFLMPETATPSRATMPSILGMPRWLLFSLITILVWGAWGVVSKVASEGVDANTNQIFFTFGLLPLIALVWRSPRNPGGGAGRRVGIGWAFLTGILGGTGNIAFFHALVMGGKASIVSPVTALFPVVTVVLAVTLLHERVGTTQKLGLVLALIAIYLLSM
jgi:transporter family protein